MLPEACALAQKLSGQLHKTEVNSEGHYLVQFPMGFDRMQMVSSSFCGTPAGQSRALAQGDHVSHGILGSTLK